MTVTLVILFPCGPVCVLLWQVWSYFLGCCHWYHERKFKANKWVDVHSSNLFNFCDVQFGPNILNVFRRTLCPPVVTYSRLWLQIMTAASSSKGPCDSLVKDLEQFLLLKQRLWFNRVAQWFKKFFQDKLNDPKHDPSVPLLVCSVFLCNVCHTVALLIAVL